VQVIASVFGFDAEEFAESAAMGEKGGAIAVELNVSCPHVREVGVEIGQRPKAVAEVTQAVKNRVHVPVFVKLSPNVTDIAEVAKAAESVGADGITAINTVLGTAVDVDSGFPILGGVLGGLSGPAIHPVALRAVYQIRQAVRIPIIGGGSYRRKDTDQFARSYRRQPLTKSRRHEKLVSLEPEIESSNSASRDSRVYPNFSEGLLLTRS
jgi:dihydroorotate dehydrogenase (NAD+) catalytic subunit